MDLWLGCLIAFVYGTVVGSFLNVCIYRLPANQSIVNPPSHCPKCNAKLRAWDNIPLVSFLLLGRKCRYCGEPISWRYFAVELLAGTLFVATYLRYGYTIDFFAYVLFVAALLIAFFVDLDHLIIPDLVPMSAVVIGIGKDAAHWIAGDLRWARIWVPFADYSVRMLPSLVGAVACFALFYAIAYVGFYAFRPRDEKAREQYEGAMGGGDVMLAGGIGAVLGLVPALVSFFLAVLLGTLVGVTIVLLKSRAEKRGVPWRTEIPFGPYMVAGAVAVVLAYPQLEAVWEAWMRFVTMS